MAKWTLVKEIQIAQMKSSHKNGQSVDLQYFKETS